MRAWESAPLTCREYFGTMAPAPAAEYTMSPDYSIPGFERDPDGKPIIGLAPESLYA